jgi:hypothetical protein
MEIVQIVLAATVDAVRDGVRCCGNEKGASCVGLAASWPSNN